MDNEQSTQLLLLTKKMRNEQKGFFSSANGASQKQMHLSEAKRLEKEVDNLIAKIESGQEELFS